MKNTISLILCSCLLIACQKSKRELPDATQNGARTFGCKVNGALFTTSGDPKNTWTNSGVTFATIADGSIEIAANQENPDESVYMRFRFGDTAGVYYLNSLYTYKGRYTGSSGGGIAAMGGFTYMSDTEHTGVVNVTRYDGNIISGTFSFDAVNDSGRIVHITEGRFDIPR
jgi:hypothetical protein